MRRDASDAAPLLAMDPLPADPTGDALLVRVSGGDLARLAALRQQVRSGTPTAYAAGCLYFRGRRFTIDPRAYVTDPETSWLVDAVNREGHRLEGADRALHVLEFGIGAGTLAISVKLDHPGWHVAGLDVDADALHLARENAAQHGVELELIESDLLAGWPVERREPDLLFGDPPWGAADDLYGSDRDAGYYERMPARSAFPGGGSRCALHDRLIAEVSARRWRSLLVLNYGVLPRELIARSAAPLREYELISPQPNLTILVGRAG